MLRSLLILSLLCWLSQTASAQLLQQPDGFLDAIYPAGAQVGQTVKCEFIGHAGLTGAKRIVVEGPPGVTVKEVIPKSHNLVEATLEIAPDALPGRRLLRVNGGPSGLTNCRPFFVGRLPEPLETEPNDSLDKPCDVQIPAVVNARLDKPLDVDCFRFQGKRGQSIVAAVSAHGIDAIMRKSFILGFLDTSLEVLSESGQVLAAAEDTIGLDPLVHYTLPADGAYIVRIKAVAYQGAPSAVYRLTLGELPYVTSVFPSGGKRGETVEVELSGPNIPPGTKRKVTIDADPFLLRDLVLEESSQRLPLVRGDVPESIEQEPNDSGGQANSLAANSTTNGRFETDGDADWYAVTLEKGQAVVFHTLAQRHLRAPVDTRLQIFDEAGKQLAENDDGARFMQQAWHDFESADSHLAFTAPVAGRYLVRVTSGSGVYGKSSIYRLTCEPWLPDFCVFAWPDAVPIWGPGATATFVVQAFTWAGFDSDLEFRVEGLPAGWEAGVSHLPAAYIQPFLNSSYGGQVLMTITAPSDAEIGAIAPFRVLARAKRGDQVVEHEAQHLTLYGNSHNDRMFLRYSRGAQAVVASPLDCRLETNVKELSVNQGAATEIPVRVIRQKDSKANIGLSIDGSTVAAGTGWRAPLALAGDQSEITIPFPLSPEWKPGTYTIVVSRSWAADIRSGRPGPCTPAIRLNILPPK